jgi:hypothetical protein
MTAAASIVALAVLAFIAVTIGVLDLTSAVVDWPHRRVPASHRSGTPR